MGERERVGKFCKKWGLGGNYLEKKGRRGRVTVCAASDETKIMILSSGK